MSTLAVVLSAFLSTVATAAPWQFTETADAAGLTYAHGYLDGPQTEPQMIAGGVAAGDYDGDGWTDLYVVRGDLGPNLLFRNRGDGTFAEVGAEAGVARDGSLGSGPAFFDADNDGWLDLFVGAIEGTPVAFFRNQGDGTFADATAAAGLSLTGNTFSATAGDVDRDGDLDLVLGRWIIGAATGEAHLWRNHGDGTFEPISDDEAGLSGYLDFDYSFTPTLVDIDGDRWPDLLMAGDFGTSRIFLNQGDGTFTDATTPVISDENGMGAAVADYDHDGDFDWFVSSIWDPDAIPTGNWGVSGNRLYRNRGDGTFDDVTRASGLRQGYWGWGSCFADFDNDGFLDLFHVNGFSDDQALEFQEDPSRLFLANGDGTFREASAEVGLIDTAQGRGVVCFDYDRDGDVDLFVANNSGSPSLFRNDGGNARSFLHVTLEGRQTLPTAVGSRVRVVAAGVSRLQELRTGCNYASQQPLELHFGLGDVETIDKVIIEWSDGEVETHHQLAANRFLRLVQGETAFAVIPTLGKAAQAGLAFLLAWAGLLLIVRKRTAARPE